MPRNATYFSQILFILLVHNANAQHIGQAVEQPFLIQPQPRKIAYTGKAAVFDTFPYRLVILHQPGESTKAANYLKKLLEEKFPQKFTVTLSEDHHDGDTSFHIKMTHLVDADSFPDQYYRIDSKPDQNTVSISSGQLLGLLYGAVTLTELIHFSEERISIPLYNIEDWPAFSRRIFPSIVEKEDVAPLLDFALRHKIETVALAHRQYPWFEVNERLAGIFAEIKKWKEKYGGPHVMQMHNIYDERLIEISENKDIANLLNVIKAGLNSGLNKVMILADDTPPFEFGRGYVLPHESDREKFAHMAGAHCYLIKKIKTELANRNDLTELYYAPAFYTYEDMHYGDMSEYDNTPWEQQAYGPLKRDLAYFGQHLPPDVFIVWTGPNVRTRVLKETDIQDWTQNLEGRVPFLWDNTIYSHHPFTTSALFTAYDNELPPNLAEITGGNGMVVNGNLNTEEMKVGMITANDYLWNPQNYKPDRSLQTAMEKRYGIELVDVLLQFKDTELNLRKKIGERALWFEADSLWKVIRNTRWITGKNPLYYHLNYNRLKALRIQLKYSVPEPQDESLFFSECKKLDDERRGLLEKVQRVNPGLFEDLNAILVRLPDQEEK